MTTTVSIDFETRSTVDLKSAGVYAYAESPDTEIMCMAYAFGDEEPSLWLPGDEPPDQVWEHVQRGGALRAWNAAFERIIWRDILVPRQGFPEVDLEQWFCTAAEARAMALPRSLGWAADVLKVPTPKDSDGRKLMLKMCKPDKKTGEYHEDPEDLQRLYDYCITDVKAERDIAKRIRRLGATERAVYLMDQRANDRGVHMDIPLIEACQDLVKQETKVANARLKEITDGQVTKVTQVQRIGEWLETEGVETEDLRKHTVRDLLAEPDDIPDAAEEVLTIRAEIGKTSAAKLKSMLRCRCSDDYARGLLMYHGASTGRWSGMLIQPQNFPRGEVKDPERYIPAVLERADLWAWDVAQDNALAVVTSLLRGCLIASPGHRLMAGDYSQIEARVLGWIAGEPYRDLEYERMAAAIFKVPVEEIIAEHARGESERRKMGKDTVLGCGYQMGWKRYIEQAWERSGTEVSEQLAKRAVTTYRNTKPGITNFWSDIEAQAKAATNEPGKITHVGFDGQIRFVVRGQFLWCILPSGRPLAYALPRVVNRETKWGPRVQLTYMGIDSYTKKWKRLSTYGGHLTENVVQAMARDVMAEGMLRLDDAGYRPILSVHDEVVCDTPDGHGSLEEFQSLMEQVPEWAPGLPVASECWEGPRYRKG